MPERALERHDLVWLAPDAALAARPAGACCAAEPDAARVLADWVAAGHPLIVARQDRDTGAGRVRLGLALPPALGKRRLAFSVARADIARSAPPPALSAASIGALPTDWQAPLSTLLDVRAIVAAAPRIYGSAALQIATGLACIGADSDLDLLLAPADWPAALAACRALAAVDVLRRGPRIDGEIRNPSADAVAWRELAAGSRRLLVKSRDAVRLVDREAYANDFPATAGAIA